MVSSEMDRPSLLMRIDKMYEMLILIPEAEKKQTSKGTSFYLWGGW